MSLSKFSHYPLTITVTGAGLPPAGLKVASDAYKGNPALLVEAVTALDALLAAHTSAAPPLSIAASSFLTARLNKLRTEAAALQTLLSEAEQGLPKRRKAGSTAGPSAAAPSPAAAAAVGAAIDEGEEEDEEDDEEDKRTLADAEEVDGGVPVELTSEVLHPHSTRWTNSRVMLPGCHARQDAHQKRAA